jgi:hypothetical protein
VGLVCIERSCARWGIEQLDGPDDLQAFARLLAGRGGMEAAIGGLLGVAATLRGAADPATTSTRR